MGKQIKTLPGLGSDLSRDASLKLVLRRVLNEAMAGGMALGVVACGSSALENSESRKTDAAVTADGPARMDAGVGIAADTGPKICDGIQPVPCLVSQWLIPERLHPNMPVSYLAPADKTALFALTVGTPCKDAQDKNECLKNLNNAKMDYLPTWALLATRGDEVLVLKDATALAKFLAPIDTATEAAVVAAAHGFFISCAAQEVHSDLGVQCLADGFKVVFSTCSPSTNPQGVQTAIVLTSGQIANESDLQPPSVSCPGVPGRAPDGLSISVANRAQQVNLAQFLLDSALFEAASIPSFLMLAEDLRALDAPAILVQDALAAAQDEVVHAKTMASLAQDAGASSGAAHVPSRVRKSLWEVAQENAVEACVRETYGALVAHHQAACATDPAIAEAMVTIAEDETRHAALGHRVAQWAEDLLSEQERRLLKTLRSQAISTLRADVQRQYTEVVYVKAGMPTPAVALRLLDSLERHVWS